MRLTLSLVKNNTTHLKDASSYLFVGNLGAKPFTVFLRITLPLLAPALISAWLLAFTLSLDDLVIASFVSGPGSTTLPMWIYSSVRLGVKPEVNALATLMLLFVVIIVLFSGRIFNRKR